MFVSHVFPLDVGECLCRSWRVKNIVKLTLNVGSPCNIVLLNVYLLFLVNIFLTITFEAFVKLKRVIKKTLSNKPTRNSGQLQVLDPFVIEHDLLVFPQIFYLNYRITSTEILHRLVLTCQLLIVSRFDISSVILIEVSKLIINIDWTVNWFKNVEFYSFAVVI